MKDENFTIQTRYSTDDIPDKFGRWARRIYYKNFLICWITKHEVHGTFRYSVRDMFPSNGNDDPYYVGTFIAGFDDIVDDVKKRFLDFLKKCE